MSGLIRHVTYEREVPLLTGMRITRTSPTTGTIKRIFPSYPDGCDGLVYLMFGIEREGKGQIWPSPTGTYLALNDWTPSMGFELNEYIEKGDQMWVEILNRDFLNPHTPVIVIEIVGGKKVG